MIFSSIISPRPSLTSFNPFKRILSLIGSVFLLIPPMQTIYEISGFMINGLGLLILIFIYFVQGKLKFKIENPA